MWISKDFNTVDGWHFTMHHKGEPYGPFSSRKEAEQYFKDLDQIERIEKDIPQTEGDNGSVMAPLP